MKFNGNCGFKSLIFHGRLLFSTNSRNTHDVFLLQKHPSFMLALNYMSNVVKQTDSKRSNVSYFVNSCGLSPESAFTASRFVHLKNPKTPENVVAFLKEQGFSSFQISKIVKIYPKILLCCPEKTILPKLEFFSSKGMSRAHLCSMISARPVILKQSLKRKIVPCFEFFKGILHSDLVAATAVTRCYGYFGGNYNTKVALNLALLRKHGVSDSNIQYFLSNHPGCFIVCPNQFEKSIEDLKQMGFEPSKFTFVHGIIAKRSMSSATWESKLNAYKHWGLSAEQVLWGFVRFPQLMLITKDLIKDKLDFLINEMGYDASKIIRYPQLLGMSMTRRLRPRGVVIKALWSKGLIKKDVSIYGVFYKPDKIFLRNYVKKYEKEDPQLPKLYIESLDLST